MLKLGAGSTLLIHHWDADGVCSAALLLEHFNRDLETWVPALGRFYLKEEEILYAQKYENVVICDMALPVNNVKQIAEKTRVTVIDHHHQQPITGIHHINPVAWGAEDEEYPSTTWVIKEETGMEPSLKTLLGIVGDREQRIKDNPSFWRLIQSYMTQTGTTFEELLTAVRRIDSCYKVGDREAVMKAPHLLAEYMSIEEVLGYEEWARNLKALEAEIEKSLSEEPEMIDGVQVKYLNTPYAIISQVTRTLAWATGKHAVVVNTGFFEDEDQLYARSSTVDMYELIDHAKRQGYSAGGKKDVMGAIIPKSETQKFLSETIKYLKKKRGEAKPA